MSENETELLGPRHVVRMALALRGALAASTGDADNPFRRVFLAHRADETAPAGAVCLRLKPGDADGAHEAIVGRLRVALDAHQTAGGSPPSVVIVPGRGAFAVERPAVSGPFPLADKAALVTGAAGAIGAGICRALLGMGCRVAATDIAPKNLAALVDELKRAATGASPAACPSGIIAVPLDVTDSKSVEAGFGEAVRTWGGIDIVIVNAGIAMVSPLVDLDPDAFRRLERVNVEGTLLTLKEAGRCMQAQGTGGDVVLVSTKNVFAPGAQFGAYSATKAAAHQLARIASLEFAPHDIRVNMVAPDAVFADGDRRSGLWAEVGPSRMKARGLDEKGLEDYYRSRNLLKARVTPDHVANAVRFFVTRQTPTTGATIPVDGGLPDSTPR